jgi:hypothetical protein
VISADPYTQLSTADRLQLLAFEAELAGFPRSLIAAICFMVDTLLAMNWKPSEEHDSQIRGWMKAKGWEVMRTNYDLDREIYAWRHDLRGGPAPTLRISRKVLEGYPAFIVLYHLDHLKVGLAIQARPAAPLAVVQKGSTVVLDELT